jgi:CRP/FNR family cyclic AMP-dependent transcriptional regulator
LFYGDFLNVWPKLLPFDATDVLLHTELFKGVPREAVLEFARKGRRLEVSAGTLLFNQGSRGEELSLIMSGRVAIRALTSSGRDRLLTFRGPGQIFGHATIAESTHDVYAVSVVNSHTVSWTGGMVLGYMREYPAMAVNLHRILLVELVDFIDRAQELLTKPAARRLEKVVANLGRL